MESLHLRMRWFADQGLQKTINSSLPSGLIPLLDLFECISYYKHRHNFERLVAVPGYLNMESEELKT